jgi:diguanylate cyclase (GGDEF)-like protein
MKANAKDRESSLIKRLEEEIIPIFEKVISEGNVMFPNPHLVDCKTTLDCNFDYCVRRDIKEETLRCWHVAGTSCSGKSHGTFLQKYSECCNCKVFKDSCPTVIEEIGEYINNIVFLMNEQEQKMLDDKHQIDHLNEKLATLVEQLDMKSKEIQKIMITDSLTKLYNRHHLATVLEDEIARCQRYGHSLAVMMIDIDEFRSFNENYGRHAGDNMLELTGKVIKENIRKFDRAFRYGGEEFVVVLPETDLTLAYIVAERIRKSFQSKTFRVTNKDGKTKEKASRTMSIGLTATFTYQTNIISSEELISQTENALSLAKDRGGNASVRNEDL